MSGVHFSLARSHLHTHVSADTHTFMRVSLSVSTLNEIERAFRKIPAHAIAESELGLDLKGLKSVESTSVSFCWWVHFGERGKLA